MGRHVQANIALVKHLNSPLFQKRYLRTEDEDVKPAEPANAIPNQTDSNVSEDSKSGKQSTSAVNSDGSTNKEVDVINEVNSNSPGGNVNGMAASSTRSEDAPVLSGVKAPSNPLNSDDPVDRQGALLNGDESKHLGEDATPSDIAVAAKEDGEAGAPEAPEQFEREPFPDDDDDEGGRRDSEILEEPETEDAQVSVRPKRYELSYWPDHLASAEKLWTAEEREKSNEWKELWKLVIQFLCDSPDAFNVWQQHYMDLDDDFEANNTLLSPLQVAAAYSIPGLVKILLDRGEPAAAELEDGRSALWFAADSTDIEIITLLLEKGASPNAHKDFPPPFNVLLWWNPKLEFVNLMLKHGAECNILDPWGFNVMHWFAIFGTDVEVLKALLEAHGDINVPDSYGETPLHKVMYNSRDLSLDLLRAFLENGANVNKDDKDSQSKIPCTYFNSAQH